MTIFSQKLLEFSKTLYMTVQTRFRLRNVQNTVFSRRFAAKLCTEMIEVGIHCRKIKFWTKICFVLCCVKGLMCQKGVASSREERENVIYEGSKTKILEILAQRYICQSLYMTVYPCSLFAKRSFPSEPSHQNYGSPAT